MICDYFLFYLSLLHTSKQIFLPLLHYTHFSLSAFNRVFFGLMASGSFIILVILLGCERFRSCKRLIRVTVSNSDGACEIGFAHDRNEFDRCVEILKEGGVVCIPTDTVYCLACAANRPDAIQRIYSIKNRPSEKPLSLWVSCLCHPYVFQQLEETWHSSLCREMPSFSLGQLKIYVKLVPKEKVGAQSC